MWPRTSTGPSILLIDGNDIDRTYFATELKRRARDYEILDAFDGRSGLNLFNSRRMDCVVLALDLPDQSGFQTLAELVPVASRPEIAVIVLTQTASRGVRDLAKKNGAYECFVKQDTSGEALDRAIQHAVFLVRQIVKEDRHRAVSVNQIPSPWPPQDA